MTRAALPHVVLVGAGHAHVEVLERWAARPPGARVTVVTDTSEAIYSGMVPGFVAGDYRNDEVSIPVEPLARRAGAEVVLGCATSIDPVRRTLGIDGTGLVDWDIASLDVGSTVAGSELPGVAEHALATRPVAALVRRLEERLHDWERGRRCRIVVVGAGAAGVELAFTLEARAADAGVDAEVILACGHAGLLPGYAPRVQRAVSREAAARGIAIAATADAAGVDETGVRLDSGHLGADIVVWATGAAPTRLVAESALPRGAKRFVRVLPTLQVFGHKGLFAAGDCAAIDGFEWVPKAGVHAVREGPVLEANLRAAVEGRALRRYEPQRDFLTLMNLGHRRALATKWGLCFTGRLAWHLKDRIDRGFVNRFRARGHGIA